MGLTSFYFPSAVCNYFQAPKHAYILLKSNQSENIYVIIGAFDKHLFIGGRAMETLHKNPD